MATLKTVPPPPSPPQHLLLTSWLRGILAPTRRNPKLFFRWLGCYLTQCLGPRGAGERGGWVRRKGNKSCGLLVGAHTCIPTHACAHTHTHTHAWCLQRSKTPFILIKGNSKRHKDKGEAKPVVKNLRACGRLPGLCSLLQGPEAEQQGQASACPPKAGPNQAQPPSSHPSRKAGALTGRPGTGSKTTPRITYEHRETDTLPENDTKHH